MIKPLQSITLKNDSGEDTTYVVASAPAIVETTEPAGVASFSDGAEGIPVRSLIADINPVQSGTGDPSPSNVRPITGWTGMNVVRTGKNRLNVTESGVTSSQRCTMTGTEGNLTFTSTGNYGRVGFSISNLTVGNTYTFSCKAQKTATSGNQSAIYLGTSNWTYNIAWLNVSPNGGRDTGDETSLTHTFTATDSTFFFGVYVTSGTGSGDVVKVKDAMLESGGSASDYKSYNGTTYPISWEDEAGTVYGGTLDVTTGLLTVTHGIVEYDGSADESWTKGGGANECYIRNDAVKRFKDYRGQMFCDKLATYKHNDNLVAQYGISGYVDNETYPSQNWLYVHLTDTTLTVADLKSWLQSNPITVCYPLATPQTYQLTPQAVMTILGQNNIWADTGDVEVAYCADTKMYIDKVLTE